ncbi:DUF445 domain-containing protein [Halonatronum saccharophilum]|uniref:DUF445 domain-containing protein n=1 Tax=Halonatronum saccharophilum TaxID=150060 RepID=UPI000480344F|nr:DUF445 family protein [Halonatronum saccharophilum]
MDLRLLLLPVIGAIIGWGTNLLAIRLIFRPYEPVNIPLINFKVQGLLPKRSKDLAKKIGEVVERDLLPKEELEEELAGLDMKDDIKEAILDLIDKKAAEKIPAFIPANFKILIINFLKEMVNNDMDPYLDELLDKAKVKIVEETKLAKLVEERVSSFEMSELEALVLQIASKELKHIEILGGFLGFIIGIGQALIVINL